MGDLLKDTLVVWIGEFGRAPSSEGQVGRDHNTKAFTMWMAGDGIRPGMKYGYEAVENTCANCRPTRNHARHARPRPRRTHLSHVGREFRLTETKGNVIDDILA